MSKYTRMHCCLDIEGGIKNAKSLIGCITVDGYILMDVREINCRRWNRRVDNG